MRRKRASKTDSHPILAALSEAIGAESAERLLGAAEVAYVDGQYERALSLLRYVMRIAPATEEPSPSMPGAAEPR